MTADLHRRAELAAIHVAKQQLRLDDATYREVVRRVSAKFGPPVDSAGLMTASRERQALIEELRTLGFRKVDRPQRAPASFQVAKIQQLWRDLRDIGALDDSSDKALRHFVKRQTGVVALAWLTADQANKVIEGLKAWHARKVKTS